jgi:hypothetical protein
MKWKGLMDRNLEERTLLVGTNFCKIKKKPTRRRTPHEPKNYFITS